MSDSPKSFFEKPQTIRAIIITLVIVCIGLLIADFSLHKHVHFDFEEKFGFYALAGFVSYVSLVLTAKKLRSILMRPEDYYDE